MCFDKFTSGSLYLLSILLLQTNYSCMQHHCSDVLYNGTHTNLHTVYILYVTPDKNA